LGEIARRRLSLVSEIASMFYGFLEEEFSRGPMLWGLGRMGEVHPELLAETLPLIEASLRDRDPQVRAWAAWCLGKARIAGAAAELASLMGDESPVKIYEAGALQDATVGGIARQALEALEQPR
jgi:hypothetical protein